MAITNSKIDFFPLGESSKEVWIGSREEALEKGYKFFYDSNHCWKDHKCPKYTKSKCCWICAKEYRVSNKEKIKKQTRDWKKKNPERTRELNRLSKKRTQNRSWKKFYYKNRDAELERAREFYKNNKHLWKLKKRSKSCSHKARERVARRRARKINATPKWVDRKELLTIYKRVPEGMQVDHIIPLANNLVCGLHVPWNLQYLSLEDNASKGNKFSPYSLIGEEISDVPADIPLSC